MDKENDKETIIASSSEERSRKHRKSKKDKKSSRETFYIEKHKDRKESSNRKSKERSRDRSRHGDSSRRKELDDEKREKDFKRDKDRHRDRRDSRDRHRGDRSTRDSRDTDRDINRHRHRSSRDDSRRKESKDKSNKDRSPHSRSKYSPRHKSRRESQTRQRSYSDDRIRNESKNESKIRLTISVKKKFEEIAKTTNECVPVTTTDPNQRDRELYITDYPEGLTPNDILQLINEALKSISANIKLGDPVLSCWMKEDQNYAFLQFRTVEETVNAMKLNGIKLLGKEIRIGKPRAAGEAPSQQLKDLFPTLTSFERDLNNPYASKNSANTTNIVSASSGIPFASSAGPTSSKLLVSNLPLTFNEEAVYKFLKAFGKIKSLELIKDPMSGHYSGQCHVEYESESDTTNALHYVMGINLQGNVLYIKRSSGLVPTYNISSTGGYNTGLSLLTGSAASQFMSAEDYIRHRENTVSKVICVRNMVTMKELVDDDEYDDLMDDVREECKNYGKVVSVKIPRPEGQGSTVPGLGKVFVEYTNRDGATFARDHLNGKTFHGRYVDVVFFPDDLYKKDQLD